MSSDIYDLLRESLLSAPRRVTVLHRLLPVWTVVQEARAVGVTWAEVGQRLAAAGITRADGQPFTPATLVWAANRLGGIRPIQAIESQKERKRTAAVHDPPSKPSRQSPLVAGDFEMPPEVEAFLSQGDAGPPAHTIDDLLKELNNGKA